MIILPKALSKLLTKRIFISVASCDLNGQPNAAPKFLLKADQDFIYLIDYTIGRTWENVKVNPRLSLSLSDADSLKGYKINGRAEIITEGPAHAQLFDELKEKTIALSVDRVIEGIRLKKKHTDFELGIPDKFIIFKVRIEEFTEIGPQGQLRKEAFEG